MVHSVESHFIALVSVALLMVIAPLFTLLLTLHYHETVSNQYDSREILLSTNAQALKLWRILSVIFQFTEILFSDTMIEMVEIKDISGHLNIAQTTGGNIVQSTIVHDANVTYEISQSHQDGIN